MELSAEQSALKIEELQNRLDEYEQLIEAIKGGEVDAFALTTNNKSEIFTLHTVDYAYRLLVERFGEGAFNLSAKGLIVYTNSYFPELLDLPYEDVIGNSFFKFIHPDSKEKFIELFNVGLTSKIKGEINILIGTKTIPVYISLTSLFPTFRTVGVIITNLTEKKREEELLKLKNAELKKLNTELQAFTSITSHDLQGPLRKIQLYISLLLKIELNQLSENGKNYLLRVQQTAHTMQILIHDLLEYARIDTTDRKFELTELHHIIDKVKSDLIEEINDKQAIVEYLDLDKALIIPFQFRQLMHNLIGNALKFCHPTQPPHIIIKSEIANGAAFKNDKLYPRKMYCHISVADNGIGIEPAYTEKIFEIFFRLYDDTQYKGTGIGLAIVKKIENHGGVRKPWRVDYRHK
jgi:PAS domain S-box-containing protein